MTIPPTTASDVYKLKSRWTRTCAKFMGCVQIAVYIYLIYATVVALSYMSVDGRHRRQPDAMGVLFLINGCMLILGIFFGNLFFLGAHFGDMCGLGLYTFFAIFSILFHLNAFFAFLILEVWMFVGLSVLPLAMHVVGLCFVGGISMEIGEIEKLLQEHKRNQQEQPPPSYSSCVLDVQQS